MNKKLKFIPTIAILITVLLFITLCGSDDKGDGEHVEGIKPVSEDAINLTIGEYLNITDFREWLTNLSDNQKQKLSNKLYEYDTSSKIDIDLGKGFTSGNVNPHYRIVEFSEFNCLHCKLLKHRLSELAKIEGENIYLESRLFPLDIKCNSAVPVEYHNNGKGSCEMAITSICADEQGKYLEFSEALFNNIARQTNDRMITSISEVGLDKEKLDECIISQKAKDRLKSDIDKANELGISGTPFLIWNGKKLNSDDTTVIAMLMSYSNPNHPLFKELLPEPANNQQ